MSIFLYNTFTRKKEVFTPLNEDRVTMYLCGPTVYSHPHIGNARPAVVFDLLFRLLKNSYSNVVYVRNITDVDDKINTAAKAQNVPIKVITEKFTRIYNDELAELGVLSPTIEPKATQHIAQMIDMIQTLLDSGHAYISQDHVLFKVSSFTKYGMLSRKNPNEQIPGARVKVASYKQDAADFILWKPASEDDPGWMSPWGRGRPGWHLECSAMIDHHLGKTIDIHAGGNDLIFPHHENELAQSMCSHKGKQFVRYWLHNGFINVDNEKMAKSVGNVLLIKDMLKNTDGEVIRLGLLSTHYRQPLEFSEETIKLAKNNLKRLYQALLDYDHIKTSQQVTLPVKFINALKDDLNSPQAIRELIMIAKELKSQTSNEEKVILKSQLILAGKMLGLFRHSPKHYFNVDNTIDENLVLRLIDERNKARSEKDFDLADKIRHQLEQMNIELEDTNDKTRWKLKTS